MFCTVIIKILLNAKHYVSNGKVHIHTVTVVLNYTLLSVYWIHLANVLVASVCTAVEFYCVTLTGTSVILFTPTKNPFSIKQ